MKQELKTQLFHKLERARYLNRELDCWSARKLQPLLGYVEWRNFLNVIEKAKKACILAGFPVRNHFATSNKSVKNGKRGRRKVGDVGITRYACYLITQNTNPSKDNIAFTQAYFSMQNRNLEIIEGLLLDMDQSFASTKSENRLSSIIYEQGTDQEGFRLIRPWRERALAGGYTTEEVNKKWSALVENLYPGFHTKVPSRENNRTAESASHNALVKELVREYKTSKKQGGNNQRIQEILIEHGLQPENCMFVKIQGKHASSWKLLTRKPLRE